MRLGGLWMIWFQARVNNRIRNTGGQIQFILAGRVELVKPKTHTKVLFSVNLNNIVSSFNYSAYY